MKSVSEWIMLLVSPHTSVSGRVLRTLCRLRMTPSLLSPLSARTQSKALLRIRRTPEIYTLYLVPKRKPRANINSPCSCNADQSILPTPHEAWMARRRQSGYREIGKLAGAPWLRERRCPRRELTVQGGESTFTISTKSTYRVIASDVL